MICIDALNLVASILDRRLSTILRDLQPGYWRCEPEPGAYAYFVRVRSFRVSETP